MTDTFKNQVLKDGWKNRRSIAWTSFIYCLIYPVFIVLVWIVNENLARLLIDLAPAIYTLAGANLVSYFTMSSWENIGGVKE